jgi:transposase, IS30 family
MQYNIKKYSRLTLSEREEISRGLSGGDSFRKIEESLFRRPGTVSREISSKGMTRESYRAEQAHRLSQQTASSRKSGKRLLLENPQLLTYVVNKLRKKWSPSQIANRLKKDYPENMSMRASPETIYATLYVLPKGELKRTLLSCLRRQRKVRKRRNKGRKATREIPNMVSLTERSPEADDRKIPGHWEGDLLTGKNRQSFLGTLVERTSRKVFLVPTENKQAETVSRSFSRSARRIPRELRKSLAYDQGSEMGQHEKFTKSSGIKVYFCEKASPWQRGTNENTNGLLRQFFPKGTDLSTIPTKELRHVERLLNGRPRKVLKWNTPDEIFNELLR